MTKCFFPLSSSAGWFEHQTLLASLERRIKVALLLYDELVVEDGAYGFVASPDGIKEQSLAPNAIRWDRFDAGLLTGQHVIPPGVTTSFAVDFLPLFARARLQDVPGLSWSKDTLVPGVRRTLREQAEKLAAHAAIAQAYPVAETHRMHLVRAWVRDSFLAYSMGASIAADGRAGRFLDAVNAAVGDVGRPQGTSEAKLYRVVLTFWLPDVDELSFEAILALRNSEQGAWLRRSLVVLQDRALELTRRSGQVVYAATPTPEEQAQIDDATARAPLQRTGTFVGCATTFAAVPGFGLLTTRSDLSRAIEEARGWACLVAQGQR